MDRPRLRRAIRQAQRACANARRAPISRRVEHIHHADEIGDEAGSGPAVDFERCARLLDRAMIHHGDPVGQGQRLLLVVGNHDGGDTEPAL